ncbi:flagellar basal-body MS-ring/collar protein FliF [Arenimonas terrae]|uniref:Flagellar M-ring protein n=1 Tax=Arenimonas terrae TaxID=2546226 RepID=A0A5C4RPU1_9GAMM|nr:flagellar basal-body MS-ring/collar protein FliF [Arenimonas terrae]TNJ33236.1 flagellar M-ring protein FliF [Arenimonas terrae]
MKSINYMKTLGTAARAALLTGAFVIVALTAVALWWALAARDEVLFGGLSEADAAEIVAALEEWKVPHQIVDGGSGILVSEDEVYALRMRLVSSGIPKGGHVGFELFEDSDFGVTEFAQRVNYQRALQGEIERTIASLPGVSDARVHLSIRRPGLFVGDQETSKASVALTMKPGEAVSSSQVRGIRSLVSAAVEGLAVERVTVLDSTGTLLAGGEAGPRGVIARDDEESEIEARIQGRIELLLRKALASDEFGVVVDVSLNFDTVRELSERPVGVATPGGITEEVRTDDTPIPPPSESTAGSIREEILRAPGAIQRISVAVVLPNGVDASVVRDVTAIISAAAGLVEARGDRVEITRMPGRPDTPDRRASEPDVIVPRRSETPLISAIPRAAWLGLGFGALMGGAAILLLRRTSKAQPADHEEALRKIRQWLAEGEQTP